MGPDVFFELEDGKKINSTIYQDQILIELLQEFWKESFGDVEVPVIMDDNAPPHKKVCISIRIDLSYEVSLSPFKFP